MKTAATFPENLSESIEICESYINVLSRSEHLVAFIKTLFP